MSLILLQYVFFIYKLYDSLILIHFFKEKLTTKTPLVLDPQSTQLQLF